MVGINGQWERPRKSWWIVVILMVLLMVVGLATKLSHWVIVGAAGAILTGVPVVLSVVNNGLSILKHFGWILPDIPKAHGNHPKWAGKVWEFHRAFTGLPSFEQSAKFNKSMERGSVVNVESTRTGPIGVLLDDDMACPAEGDIRCEEHGFVTGRAKFEFYSDNTILLTLKFKDGRFLSAFFKSRKKDAKWFYKW